MTFDVPFQKIVQLMICAVSSTGSNGSPCSSRSKQLTLLEHYGFACDQGSQAVPCSRLLDLPFSGAFIQSDVGPSATALQRGTAPTGQGA